MTTPKPARILVVEDSGSTALLILRLLRERGHVVRHVQNGALALQRLHGESFDLVVSDWRMPTVDGLELIRRMREEMPQPPPVVMQTAIESAEAREQAVLAGADEYVVKPWRHADLLAAVDRCLQRAGRDAGTRAAAKPRSRPPPPPPGPAFHCVCIAASTGGPDAVRKVMAALTPTDHAAFLLVVHGPAWMLEAYVRVLGKVTTMPAHLASDGLAVEPGHVYLAPGDHHTLIDAGTLRLQLVDDDPLHHVRPAADPLFRTAAAAFGRRTTAAVLTGLGQDGTVGASLVYAAGGRVLVQEPSTCVAPSMPSSVLAAGIPCVALPLDEMAPAIALLARESAAACPTPR